uniref:LNS2/PITP domain-containing protein n=3 Tax=Palpitomonas bilix TaxID=652834 RepID=A0A7S3GJ51_9EUKA|mmetsp:Transcript_5723/g.13400  ORF Transcript_5723/g.13400 Transcript_5723/m.13400 type:complete len:686 (+) Transcript_5723:49-2106(+)
MASLIGGFFRSVYQKLEINSATLSGAIDIIVAEHEDGTLCSTPFHVTFGKFQLLRSNEKTISIYVNDEETDLRMTLGKAGEAYFLMDEEDPRWFSSAFSSPMSSPMASDDEMNVSPPLSPRASSPPPTPTAAQPASPSRPPVSDSEPVSGEAAQNDAKRLSKEGARATQKEEKTWSWQWGNLPKRRRNERGDKKERTRKGEDDILAVAEQSTGMRRSRSLMELNRYDTPELSLTVAHAVVDRDEERGEREEDMENEREVEGEAQMIARMSASLQVEASTCSRRFLSLPEHDLEERFDASIVNEEALLSGAVNLYQDDLVFRINGKYCAAPDALRILFANYAFGSGASERCLAEIKLGKQEQRRSRWRWWLRRGEKKEKDVDVEALSVSPPQVSEPLTVKTEKLADVDIQSDVGSESESSSVSRYRSRVSHKKRTLIPPSDILKGMHLREGRNTIRFVAGEGKQVVGSIYKWSHHAKIVVSDIDGTITKSDVLGQVLPIVGKDWSHTGVTELYSKIEKNGYRFLYLTARAIGQAETTRTFLRKLSQEGIQLPDGPVLTSPDRMLASFTREVIMRRPQDFKIACLRNVKHVFPVDHNPFYAGFGNRMTDVIAYQSVGVPEGRILTINPSGEVTGQTNSFGKTSYSSLSSLVDVIFPELPRDERPPDEAFNAFNYWKVPVEDFGEIDF